MHGAGEVKGHARISRKASGQGNIIPSKFVIHTFPDPCDSILPGSKYPGFLIRFRHQGFSHS